MQFNLLEMQIRPVPRMSAVKMLPAEGCSSPLVFCLPWPSGTQLQFVQMTVHHMQSDKSNAAMYRTQTRNQSKASASGRRSSDRDFESCGSKAVTVVKAVAKASTENAWHSQRYATPMLRLGSILGRQRSKTGGRAPEYLRAMSDEL